MIRLGLYLGIFLLRFDSESCGSQIMLQTSLTTVQTDEREIRTEDTGDNERVEGKIHKPEIEVADSAEDRMWVGRQLGEEGKWGAG